MAQHARLANLGAVAVDPAPLQLELPLEPTVCPALHSIGADRSGRNNEDASINERVEQLRALIEALESLLTSSIREQLSSKLRDALHIQLAFWRGRHLWPEIHACQDSLFPEHEVLDALSITESSYDAIALLARVLVPFDKNFHRAVENAHSARLPIFVQNVFKVPTKPTVKEQWTITSCFNDLAIVAPIVTSLRAMQVTTLRELCSRSEDSILRAVRPSREAWFVFRRRMAELAVDFVPTALAGLPGPGGGARQVSP